jgi:5-methylcytosine-specific restriction endonuclease McrA
MNFNLGYRARRRQYYTQRLRHGEHWELIFWRDGFRCRRCGCDDVAQLELDHITPIALGGSRHDPDNQQVLCQRCNLQKQAEDGLRPSIEVLRAGKLRKGRA